jgi:pimeloyl-ACP methyl ester carboxylesterase
MADLIFIHGLNTYGDHDIHIGPLKFGSMHGRLERAFFERNIKLFSLSGSMTATPLEQAEQIAQQVQSLALGNRFHLLGQSTGGLVARALALHPELRDRIASVMTIGTPHSGASAAEFGLAFSERHPFLQRFFAVCGYDTTRRLNNFRTFTPKAVEEFCQKLSKQDESSMKQMQVSFICQVEHAQISWPLLALASRLNPDHQPGDGFISTDSQKFGLTQGPFALDHFGELGFFPHLSRTARAQAALEFNHLIDAVSAIVHNEARLSPRRRLGSKT